MQHERERLEMCIPCWFSDLYRNDYLGYLDIDGRLILKWIKNMIWWHKLDSSRWTLVNTVTVEQMKIT
jgi:hypothetical protein